MAAHTNHFNMTSVAQKPIPNPVDEEGAEGLRLLSTIANPKENTQVSMQDGPASHSPEEGAEGLLLLLSTIANPKENTPVSMQDGPASHSPEEGADRKRSREEDVFLLQDWYKRLCLACDTAGVNLFEIPKADFLKLNEMAIACGLRDPTPTDAETYTGVHTKGKLLQFLLSSGTVMLNDESTPGEEVQKRLKGAKIPIGAKKASAPCNVKLTAKENEFLQRLKWFDIEALLRAAQNMQESDDMCVLLVLRAMLAAIHADPKETTGDKQHKCNKLLITCVKSFVNDNALAPPMEEEGDASFYAKIIVVLMHALKQSSPTIGGQIDGLMTALEDNGHHGPPWAYLVVMEKYMPRLPYIIMLAAAEHWDGFQKTVEVESASQKAKTDAIKAATKAAKAAEMKAEDVAKAAEKAAKAAAKEEEDKIKTILFASDHEQNQQVVAEGLSGSTAVLFKVGSGLVLTMGKEAMELLLADPEEGGKYLIEGLRYQLDTLGANAPLALALVGIENENDDGITWEGPDTPTPTPVVPVEVD